MPGSDVPLTMFCGPLPTMSGDVVIVVTILVLWGNFDKSHPFVGLCVINSSCVQASHDRMFLSKMYSSLECILDLLLLSTLFVWVLLENYILLIYFLLICFCLAGVFFLKDLSKRLEHACIPWLNWLPNHHKGGEVFKICTALLPCWRIFCFFLCTLSCSLWQPLMLLQLKV